MVIFFDLGSLCEGRACRIRLGYTREATAGVCSIGRWPGVDAPDPGETVERKMAGTRHRSALCQPTKKYELVRISFGKRRVSRRDASTRSGTRQNGSCSTTKLSPISRKAPSVKLRLSTFPLSGSLFGTCASFADLEPSKKPNSMGKSVWYAFGFAAAALLAMTRPSPNAIKDSPAQWENVGVQESLPDWRLVTERSPYMRSER
jgi:hypothetical protein